MRKKLLITTALVALVSASNAWAADEIVINTDKSIVDGSGIDVGDKVIDNSQNTQKLIVTDGARLDIHNLGGTKNLFNVNGGEVEITDGEIHSEGIANISGGEITIKGGELTIEDPGAEMNISGGTINLSSHPSRTSGFGVNIADENPTEGLIETALGPVEMTGGTINILSGKASDLYYDEDSTGNLITGTSLNISGGELNINEGAGVSVIKGFINEKDVAKGIVNVTDKGIVNLSGTLRADVSGNGNLNIKTSSALVDGNVSGSNLTFEADHSLSKLVSGTIGDLASLNINKGASLTFDKSLQGNSFIDHVNVDGQLNVNEDMFVSNDLNLSQGTINLNGKSLNIMNGGIEMTGGVINMKDGSLDPDLTLWAAKDINISGGIINMDGANASIDTLYDWLDAEGNQLPKPTPGNINIRGGTINVNSNSAEISSEGEINVSDDAVINIASGATLSSYESFGVENSDFVLGDKATINLTDTGTINLSGGLLANVEGGGNLNVKSSSALVDGNVSGSNLTFEADHSLSKAVSGTISNLASLNVNKGTLTYDAPTGKIGNLNVAGGLDIGANTVNATNVDFKDNSSLALRVAATDNYGKINADNITIGKDTTMKVTLDNGVVGNGENTDLKFLNGKVSGSFTNKIAENSRYDIKWNEDGSLNITGTATASDVVTDAGGTTSNAATAEAWDSVTSSTTASAGAKAVASVLSDLSQNATTAAGQKAYVDALTAVAPEVAPMVQKTQTETANQVFSAVSTRLTGGSISTGSEGMSSGDSNPDAAVWVQGMYNHSKLDDSSDSYGFDSNSSGVALGIEKFINKDVKIGAGYAYTNTDIDGFMRSTDVDTHTAILYGEYKPSNWFINGIATYGWSDYSEDKNVSGQNINADYDVETFGLQAMTGYDMQFKNFGLTPEVGLRYVHIKQDAYKDYADQDVSGNDSDILTGVIGAKVNKTFALDNGMLIKPEARVAATYDLFNDDVNSVVTLANGSAYAVDGEALDRFGMEFGAGVTAEVNDNVEFSLGYEGKFREDYQDHTGLINAKYKF